jgi:hypothetical protein
MRAFDVVGIGVALVLVTALAWLFGRFAGRRDWRISSLLLGTLLLSLTVQIDILAVQAWFDNRAGSKLHDFSVRLGARIVEAATAPEFSVFLLIFAAFIGMLAWSSTPARKA